MTSRLLIAMAAAALLAFATGAPTQAIAAEDCPRGTLDQQYCDRDGDLTADLPLDPAEWVDPDTIVFSYTRRSRTRPSTKQSGRASSITWPR